MQNSINVDWALNFVTLKVAENQNYFILSQTDILACETEKRSKLF